MNGVKVEMCTQAIKLIYFQWQKEKKNKESLNDQKKQSFSPK